MQIANQKVKDGELVGTATRYDLECRCFGANQIWFHFVLFPTLTVCVMAGLSSIKYSLFSVVWGLQMFTKYLAQNLEYTKDQGNDYYRDKCWTLLPYTK